MCGIKGIISKNTSVFPGNDHILVHRGPDDYGVFQDDYLCFIHYRLSIQDPSPNAHQPMFSEDGNYCIIFNGEIYNHWEIRKKLAGKYFFKSSSDTETLLYAFIEYGTELLNKINGIFAFAIYDKNKGELFIARDSYGVKPLYYYYQDPDTFAFASEIKALVPIPGFNKSINPISFLSSVTLLHNISDHTNFKEVKKLLPGHYIRLNVHKPKSLELKSYYSIPFHGSYSSKNESDLLKGLEDKLFESIERQLLSDVPIGYFLSGGIDSSLLVAMTRSIYPHKNLQCFTIRNLQSEYEGFEDDYRYAKLMASSIGAELECIPSEINIDELDAIIYHLDEAQADPAAFHTYNIAKRAKEMGYKVLIGGIGADEIFSGYRRHQIIPLERLIHFIPKPIQSLIGYLTRMLKTENSSVRRLSKVLNSKESTVIDRVFSYTQWVEPIVAYGLFNENFQTQINKNFLSDEFHKSLMEIPEEESVLNKILYWEMKNYLPNNNLNYTDKMGMAHGVEIRVPYLDKELVEFSTQLPPALKLKGVTTKYLLRKLAEKYLPQQIIERPKTGFGAPIRNLVRNNWDNVLKNKLGESKLLQQGLFNPDKVWQLINDNKAGKIDASYSIWALLVIESWVRQFVDE